MADRWGPDGPPDEAYSRVTRDLAAVTAAFASWLDELPERLVSSYHCRPRPTTAAEQQRLANAWTATTFAVEPADADCATLLVARGTFEGGTSALIGLGVATQELVPSCFCDACDEDSDSMIEQAGRLVRVATGGCHEFRRPARHGLTRWLEQGYVAADGSASCGGPDERGAPFARDWAPWPTAG